MSYSNDFERGSEAVPGYTLIEELGEGAIGKVWKATGPGGIECALKFVDLSSKSGFKEFKTLHRIKRIKHPNLIPLNAFFVKDSDGEILRFDENTETNELEGIAAELILIMGLGEKTLEGRLKECRTAGERGIPIKELMVYMDDSASGIDFLNVEQGIQHCDIKPHNILIVSRRAQVCDYGLARVLGGGGATKVLGTPFYQAPELAMDGAPSEATDQYSLALSYIQLRTGKLPFVAESPLEMMLIHVEGKYDLSRLPDPERTVIKKALARKPRDRFPTVSDMVQALKAAASGGAPSSASMPSKGNIYVSDPSIPRGLKPNAEIVPGYYLQRRIGKGGYGEVWSARAPGGKDVAIKVVSKLKATHQQQEFKALELMKRLEHDGLLELESYWLLDKEFYPIPDNLRGQPGCPTAEHLVMITKLAKKNLLQRLDEYKQSGQRGIPVRELIAHMKLIADALDYLNTPQHEMDGKTVAIMHRDIKPENILLMGNNKVKVSDFGLAKALEGTDAAKIGEQSVGYTPAYAAPELFKNEVHSTTDQYSLGIMYYKLRTGKFPFDPDARNLMMIHIRGELDLGDLPEPERQVVARATALRPTERYSTCLDMVRDLLKACGFVSTDSFDIGSSQADIAPASSSKVPGLPSKRTDSTPNSNRGKSLRPEELEDRGLLRATQGEIDLDKGPGLGRSGTERKAVYDSSEEWAAVQQRTDPASDSRRGLPPTKPNDSRRSGPRQDTPPEARSSGTTTPRTDAKTSGRFTPKPPADNGPEAPQGTVSFQPDGYNEPTGHGRVTVDLDAPTPKSTGRSSGNYKDVRTSGRFTSPNSSNERPKAFTGEVRFADTSDDPLAPPADWEPERKSGSSLAGILVALLLLIVLAGGGVAGYLYFSNANSPVAQNSSKTNKPSTAEDSKNQTPTKGSTDPVVVPPTEPKKTDPAPPLPTDAWQDKIKQFAAKVNSKDWRSALTAHQDAKFPTSGLTTTLATELADARKGLVNLLLEAIEKSPLTTEPMARDGLMKFYKDGIEKSTVDSRLIKALDVAARASLKDKVADSKVLADSEAYKDLASAWLHLARAEALTQTPNANQEVVEKELAGLGNNPLPEVAKFASYIRALLLLASKPTDGRLLEVGKQLEAAYTTPIVPELAIEKRLVISIRPAFQATLKFAKRQYIDPFEPLFENDEAKLEVVKKVVPLAARFDKSDPEVKRALAFLYFQTNNRAEAVKIAADITESKATTEDYSSVLLNVLRFDTLSTDKDKIDTALKIIEESANFETETNGGEPIKALSFRLLQSVLTRSYDLIKDKKINLFTPDLAARAAKIACENGRRLESTKPDSQRAVADYQNYVKIYSKALELDTRSTERERARFYIHRANITLAWIFKERQADRRWGELLADARDAEKADPNSPQLSLLNSQLRMFEYILKLKSEGLEGINVLKEAERLLLKGFEQCGNLAKNRETRERLVSHAIAVYAWLMREDKSNDKAYAKKLLTQLDQASGNNQASSVGLLLRKGEAYENLLIDGFESNKTYQDIIKLYNEVVDKCDRAYKRYNRSDDPADKLSAEEWLEKRLQGELRAASIRFTMFEWGTDNAARPALLKEAHTVAKDLLSKHNARFKTMPKFYDQLRYYVGASYYRLGQFEQAELVLGEEYADQTFKKKCLRELAYLHIDKSRMRIFKNAGEARIASAINQARNASDQAKALNALTKFEALYIDASIVFFEGERDKALEMLKPAYDETESKMIAECKLLGWRIAPVNATYIESAIKLVRTVEENPRAYPASTRTYALATLGGMQAEMAGKTEGEEQKRYREEAKINLKKALDLGLDNDVNREYWSKLLQQIG